MTTLTRRSFVAAAGAAALLPASAALTKAAPATSATAYLFFNAAEARFIEPACARLIPFDANGPGALEVGACTYVDAQLAGPWGSGELLHRTGVWQPGSPAPAGTPARFVRTTLHSIEQELRRRGRSFDLMPLHAQDLFLGALRRGDAGLGGAARGFFDLLLQLTVEGFFSSPRRGPSRGRIPWQVSGFPGAFSRPS